MTHTPSVDYSCSRCGTSQLPWFTSVECLNRNVTDDWAPVLGETAERYLVVNADDFGRSEGVNRGILRAHERGIVTSTSLMVRWPAAEHAARAFRG